MEKIIPKVSNYYKAARKIWEFATELDFDDQATPVQTPETDEEIAAFLNEAEIVLPAGVKVKFVRDDRETFHLVLRDRETMRKSLEELRSNDGEYDFPEDLRSAYVEFFSFPERFRGEAEKQKRVELVTKRLGDYTFSTCAS